MKDNKQNGNALFFILIAVVMLGLLTIILSRGGSNVEQTGSFERNTIQASKILRFAKSIEAAVQQMKLRNISENEISFQNDISTTDYTNSRCDDASDSNFPSCLVFDVEGAGLTYQKPDANWLDNANSGETYYGDWLFTGDVCIPEIGEGRNGICAADTGNLELLAVLPYIDLTLCQQINKTVKARISTGNPPSDESSAWTSGSSEFKGVYGVAARVLADPAPSVDIANSYTGCFEGDQDPPSGTYHFYHVILAR